MDYQQLKQRHRAERDNYHTNLSLRVHRSLSWLQRAEQAEDPDGRFIFLWIAFNAAYATEIDDEYRTSEKLSFGSFLEKLSDLDGNRLLEQLTWTEFPKSIRVLLSNRYVFQGFWDFHNDKITQEEWESQFEKAKVAAQAALGRQDTPTVLGIALHRIYTLRNQLIHGGATWNSSVNRDQVRDCVALMEKLVPAILTIMMDNSDTLWGDACYPVVEG
ncbi:HEPN domain-containing protein [Marinobacter sp. S6332]|uniref:HEPN domain-containing protein n=1 Tax=Marinobacter sp. S6332 TaxID=2926403 RepID=UPI001FF2CC40|nr:HEPN domain-containing protein [Marinobacter sp. S6332]